METWMKTSLILCVFGFLKEFRPSEPFVSPFITDYKNFTEEQVNQYIYPIGIYSYLGLLILVFLVTDLLRYKPVIVVIGLSGIVTFSLLCWGTSIEVMQILEVTYGLFMASEVAYFTYIYAQVDKTHYQAVTSHTRVAFLLGRFMSGVVSQSLISTNTANYYHLLYITISSETIATVWAFLLPPVKHSMYFHRQEITQNPVSSVSSSICMNNGSPSVDNEENTERERQPSKLIQNQSKNSTNDFCQKFLTAYKYLWHDFKQAFSNTYVLKWSIWWALATCGFLQSITYIQMLWKTIQKDVYGEDSDDSKILNGGIEAAYTLIGAGTAFVCGWLTVNWQLWGELVLALCSALQGICLLLGAYSSSLWLAYVTYIIFGALYHPMITVANSEVAKYISEDSYALVFGVNTFLALILQSILTLVVVSGSGFTLGTRDQFKVYGSCYLVMAAFFMPLALYFLSKHFLCKSTHEDNKALA